MFGPMSRPHAAGWDLLGQLWGAHAGHGPGHHGGGPHGGGPHGGGPHGGGPRGGGPRGRGRGRGPGWEGPGSGWGPGFWGPPFGPFGRGPRARRGDVRAAILQLLTEGPMHGYEMIRELQTRSGGVWRASPGSVYPTLQALEDEDLVRSEEVGGKRRYALTDAGRAAAESAAGDSAPWDDLAGAAASPLHELRNAGMGVVMAAMQAASAGNEDQLRRIVADLRDTRTRIYRILGEDEPTVDS